MEGALNEITRPKHDDDQDDEYASYELTVFVSEKEHPIEVEVRSNDHICV